MGRSETERQRQYFDAPRNQYPPRRIVTPPLHTELELRYVLERLAGISRGAHIVDFGSGTGRRCHREDLPRAAKPLGKRARERVADGT